MVVGQTAVHTVYGMPPASLTEPGGKHANGITVGMHPLYRPASMTTPVHEIATSGAASCGPVPPSFFPDELEVELEAVLDALLDSVLEAVLDTLLDALLDSVLAAVLDTLLDSVLEAALDTVLEAALDAALDVEPEATLDAVLDAELDREVNPIVSFLLASDVVPTLLLLLQPTAPTRSSAAMETPGTRQASATCDKAFMALSYHRIRGAHSPQPALPDRLRSRAKGSYYARPHFTTFAAHE